MLVEGPLIAAMGPDLVPPDQDTRIIDATGHLLMPGLINGHLHSPGNLMKGAVVDQPLELFMLYEVPPLMTVPESARLYYLRTLLGAVEMLKIGVTAVHDDAFFIPVPTRETVAAVMTAYSNAGMRATVTLDQPNVVEYEKYPFLEDILPPHVRAAMRRAPLQSDAELLTAYRNFIADWNGAAGGRLRCAVSCSAPQRVTPSYLEALTDLARQHDLPFDIHILETRLQRVLGQVKYGGRSLIRYVHDLGLPRRAQDGHPRHLDRPGRHRADGQRRLHHRPQPDQQPEDRLRRHALPPACGTPASRSASAPTRPPPTTPSTCGTSPRPPA